MKKKEDGLIKTAIIASLLKYKKQFKGQYGDMIIACDGRNYWRKQIFPNYKYGRSKNQDKSEFDWDFIFQVLNELREDLKEYFPWKVIHLDEIEADDINAVLVKYATENETVSVGIMDEPPPILIAASDHDASALTKYSNVRQYCPKMKKFKDRLTQKELTRAYYEHIVKGDSGDGIPNIKMDINFFANKVDGDRQKIISSEVIDLFVEHGEDAWDHLPKDKVDSTVLFDKNGKPKKVEESDDQYYARIEFMKKRYAQNRELVIFDYIPQPLCDRIVNEYLNTKPKGSKVSVRNYFIKNRFRTLLDEADEV